MNFNALVAQWLEQGSHKPVVAGSSPAGRTNKEHRYNKQEERLQQTKLN